MIRVLLADDHPIVRDGLAALLAIQGDVEVVGEAGDGVEAIELFHRLRPDVTLMDLSMPGFSGVEAIEAIRRDVPDARFIVLTTFEGDEDIRRALEAGAASYLLKSAPARQLVEAVRAVHAGETRVPPEIAARLAARPASSELTDREREVLALLVAGRSNREIADELDVSEGTVKGYVNALLAKLGVRDRTQAVTTAIRRGLVRL